MLPQLSAPRKELITPVLAASFSQERGLYNEEDVLRAKLALLEKTNMVGWKGFRGLDCAGYPKPNFLLGKITSYPCIL